MTLDEIHAQATEATTRTEAIRFRLLYIARAGTMLSELKAEQLIDIGFKMSFFADDVAGLIVRKDWELPEWLR